MTDKKISNLPAPIAPVRGGGATGLSRKSSHETEVNQVHKNSPPDWSCWLAGRSVTLAEAVALTLNLDPDSLQKTGCFITSKSFADQGSGELFSKRLGAIQGCFNKTNIKLSVIAVWAVVEAKWAGLPLRFVAMAATEPTSAPGVSAKNTEPAPAVSVASVETLKAGPRPLTTGDIAFCFAGLRWKTETEWKKPLGDKPKWLNACIVMPGVRGVSERRWDPVCIGAALVDAGHAKPNRVRAKFQSQPLLTPWLDKWKTYEADYLDTE